MEIPSVAVHMEDADEHERGGEMKCGEGIAERAGEGGLEAREEGEGGEVWGRRKHPGGNEGHCGAGTGVRRGRRWKVEGKKQ